MTDYEIRRVIARVSLWRWIAGYVFGRWSPLIGGIVRELADCSDAGPTASMTPHHTKEIPMSSHVRAKFRCDSVTEHHFGAGSQPRYTAKLSPVYGNGDPNHENTKFWKSTPTGSLELSTIEMNPFRPGAHYYVDFTEAAEEVKPA